MSKRREEHPEDLYLQVTVEEIDALLAMGPRKFLKDGSKIVSLLRRMRFTLLAAHDAVRGMQRHIAEQSAHLARVGSPTTLNPLDAVRYLDDEQKEQIFDRITRERLRQLRDLVQRAEDEHSALVGQLELVRETARALSQQADLPPHVRAEVTRRLAALPLEAANVHHPPMIDFPDPEPGLSVSPTARPHAPTQHGAAAAPGAAAGTSAPSRGPDAPETPVPAAPAPPPAAPDPGTGPVGYGAPVAAAPAAGGSGDADAEDLPVFVDPYAPATTEPAPVFLDPYSTDVDHREKDVT